MKAMRKHSQARSTTRAVGVAVASYVNVDSGLAFPGNDDLKSWGWSERTIQESLRQLEDLGEIERVPEMEDPRRPRIYRLPLAGQIALLDGGGATLSAPADIAPAARLAGAALTRVREGTLEPKEQNPPEPPQLGGRPQDPASDQPTTTPRTALAERVPGARRRPSRRRRGRLTPSSVQASEPCPLLEVDAPSEALLAVEWERLGAELLGLLGESVYMSWIAPGHLHETGQRVVIGYPPGLIGWGPPRYGGAVERVAGVPVAFVPCTGHPQPHPAVTSLGRDPGQDGTLPQPEHPPRHPSKAEPVSR